MSPFLPPVPLFASHVPLFASTRVISEVGLLRTTFPSMAPPGVGKPSSTRSRPIAAPSGSELAAEFSRNSTSPPIPFNRARRV